MFKKIFSPRKYKFFSKSDWDEIDSLIDFIHAGKFEKIAKLDRKPLRPKTNGYDAIKLMFHLIASTKLLKINSSVDIFRDLVFNGGLSLYEPEEQQYLEFYAHNLLKATFGEDLVPMPDDIRKIVIDTPNFENVSKDIRQLFIFKLNS